MSPWRAAAIGEDAHSVLSAITGRWRSGQDFPRWIALGDRFTAANSNPDLAQPGQLRPSNLKKPWSFERQVHSETCRTIYFGWSAEADGRVP